MSLKQERWLKRRKHEGFFSLTSNSPFTSAFKRFKTGPLVGGLMGSEQSRTLLAVVLSGLILIVWNYFFNDPPQREGTPRLERPLKPSEGSGEIRTRPSKTEKGPPPISAPDIGGKADVRAKVYEISHRENSYRFNSHFDLLTAKTIFSTTEFALVTGPQLPFELLIRQKGQYVKALFQFHKKEGRRWEGLDPNLGLSITLDILDSGKLHVRIDSQKLAGFRMVFRSQEFDPEKEGHSKGEGASFIGLSSNQKFVRKFLLLGEKLEDILVGDEDSGDLQSKWFGIDSNYHLFVFTLPEKKSIHYQSYENGRLAIDFNEESSSIEGNFVYTKKYYDNLKALGENLHRGVDFGFFSIVAVPLFKGLQFIYKMIPNWGLAIILLTLLIRIVTFPLYYKQMKSMNKMKKIQPKLQKLKEKHKGDPRRQQTETMELFKREGVNPMGGCLPLILQMPIFIAFYNVLTVSAELDNRPFVGWITSLTEKDPYYILPIVVTFLMWMNQKIMPQTATDPTQQKVMSYMPLIFGFIFLNMPAGLNLYILVSTGFGIWQQVFVNKRMELSSS